MPLSDVWIACLEEAWIAYCHGQLILAHRNSSLYIRLVYDSEPHDSWSLLK